MKTIIVASNNEHKIKEIRDILSPLDLKVIGLKEADIDVDVVEDGKNFEENAFKKAYEIHKLCKDKMVLADDSGLCVDALRGEPGIYSARYSGVHGDDIKNNIKLIKNLEGVKFEDRKAKFICSLCLIMDNSKVIKVNGEVNGYIIEELKTSGGFGYDPLFYYPPFKKTFGELTSEEKNSVSHRKEALKRLESILRDMI